MEIEKSLHFSECWQQSELLVSSSGFVKTDSHWRQKVLPVPYSRVYFVTEGSGMLISDREEMLLEPGYLYLAPCGSPCGFYGTDTVTKLFFHINVIMPNGYDMFASCKTFARIPFAISRTLKLRDWYLSEDTLKQTLLKGAIWEVVAAFANKLHLTDEDQGRYSELVRRTIVYIREHLTACLTINAVANGVFCSLGTLTQAFRNEVGVTIAQYIEDLVLQEAQWRLLDTEDTIGKISADLGFCDQFYFSRRFTKRFQITPRDYRKNRAKYGR